MNDDTGFGFRIRPCRHNDLAELYRVCLLTGDAGQDASALHHDPELPGHLYVGPYASLDPEHALVLEDPSGRVSGYSVGVIDTAAFARQVRQRWLPALQRRYPDPAGDPARWTPDEQLLHLLHHPEGAYPLALPAALRPYPSHLHINLLPRAQGRGLGGELLARLLARLHADGSTGVHLGVAPGNRRALAFYQHLGFERIARTRTGQAVWMGRLLA